MLSSKFCNAAIDLGMWGLNPTLLLPAVSNEAQLASVRAAFASQGADGTKQHQPAVSRSAAGKKW